MTPYIEEWSPSVDTLAIVYAAISSANEKCYIGFTTKRLKTRARHHFSEAKHRSRNTKFGRAIRKYGEDNFSFFVIAEYKALQDALIGEMEMIAKWRPEYNIATGGHGMAGHKHSESSKAKMRAWHAAHPEHKPWLGKKRPGAGDSFKKWREGPDFDPAKLIRIRSKASIEKMIATRKANPQKPPTERLKNSRMENVKHATKSIMRPVLCITDGKTYESARAADRAYGLYKSCVAAICNPNTYSKSARGLEFRYV